MFLQQPFDHHELESVTQPDGMRFYTTPDGYVYPSVTTLLGQADFLEDDPEWKQKWVARVGQEEADRVSRRATARGKAIHGVAEKYLRNDPSWDEKLMPYVRMDFARIRSILDKKVTKVFGNEIAVWSHRLKTAGRTDLVCEWEGEPAILDFKTSLRPKEAVKIPKYFVQGAAYSVMVSETYGVNTEKVIILMVVDHDSPIVFEERVTDWEPLVDRVFLQGR